MSSTFSKLLEMFILKECNDYESNDYQFGFIKDRGTNSVISFAHDVVSYCNYNCSLVFACSRGRLRWYPTPHVVYENYECCP